MQVYTAAATAATVVATADYHSSSALRALQLQALCALTLQR
jgi:hypothetical protein